MIRLKTLLPLFLLAGGVVLRADTSSAAIAGKVFDSSGGALVNANVSIANPETGIERSTATNGAGSYEFLGLQTGTYSVTASRPQFMSTKRSGLAVRVGDRVRVDLILSPGIERETVLVTGVPPPVQVDSNTTSTVLNKQLIQDLPANGRQLQNLFLLVPGVSSGWNLSTLANRYGKARENTEGAFTVNGARARSNDFIFDGAPMNLRQYNVINFEPSTQAVGEVQVITSVPAAEYGGATGGVVNIVTRAGTRNFHGSLYEFFRNDKLDANNTFNNQAGLPRGRVRQNQFGGTFAGPLFRNKHFFFLNTEIGKNIESSETRLTSVPAAAEQAGTIQYFDAAGVPRILDLGSRITPLSRGLIALYPAPNTSNPGGLNFNTPLPIALTDYQYSARTDHHFTERDIVTVRTSWNLNDQTYIINRFGGPYIPGFSLPNPERTTNGTLGYFHTFSPALVNEAHLGINRYTNLLGNGDSNSASGIGLPNGSSANGIPTISFPAGTLESLGGASFFNRDQNETTIFFSDSLSYLRGNHHLKFGGEVSRFRFNTRGASNQRGTVLFDGSQNGIIPRSAVNQRAGALADLLLGLPFQANITTGQFGRGYRDWNWAFYAQDNWRFSPRLTLNYGLRYDYVTPWTEVNNKLSNFLPGQGIVTPDSRNFSRLYKPGFFNFAPRVGLAWDLTGQSRTILRAAFGIRYDTNSQSSTVQQIENNAPFSAAGVSFSPTPFSQGDSPSTTLLNLRSNVQPANSLAALPRKLPNPEVLQSSFSIQQALGDSWVSEIEYQFTRGFHLPVGYNINQVPIDLLTPGQRHTIQQAAGPPGGAANFVDSLRPFPTYNSITLFENSAVSSYHALQLKLERRFTAGLTMLASYVFSKSIDNATDFGSSDASEQVLDSRNLARQRGPSSFDVTHRFTGAFNYLLPFGRFWAARGWQINSAITVQGGQPFTPYASAFDPFRNESFNRLNVIGDPQQNVPSGYAYNPAAFAQPSQGTFGNSGRNIIRGGGFASVDVSLFRNIALHEGVNLQLRFEATNTLNRVNYQGPITNQTASAGQFISAAPPRQVQIGAKFIF